MKPSSETIAGAIEAWRDMGLKSNSSSNDIDSCLQWKVFLKDISNFEKLLENLTKKYNTRAIMRDALFERDRDPPKRIPKSKSR